MYLNPEILSRYFKGNYSKKDFDEIKSVFGDPVNQLELKEHLEKHWAEYDIETLPQGSADILLHKIHHQIRLEETISQRSRFFTAFQRVAAVLIIPITLAFFAVLYFQGKKEKPDAYAEIQCPLGVRTRFQLPDGTTGFLNSGSMLKYPVSFSGNRNVSLTGEACFDVAHDKSHPFVVHTSNLNIKVLGTNFNVIAYENDTKEEVILTRGKVEILSKEGRRVEILQPNQKLVLNTSENSYKKDDVEAVQYVGWTEGRLVLRNENIVSVAERMGRWYNVDIEIEDEELLNYAFRATFIDEPLEEVLKLLALTAPLTYEEQPRETTSDNTYQKRKVTVKLDKKRLDAFK